jgi:hypothetical protein
MVAALLEPLTHPEATSNVATNVARKLPVNMTRP